MKALLLAALLVGSTQVAHADWVFQKNVAEVDTQDQEEIGDRFWMFELIRTNLDGKNLASPSKLVVVKLFGKIDQYVWDGKCDTYPKGQVQWFESSGANYYYADNPNEMWQTQVGMGKIQCRDLRMNKRQMPQERTRRLR